MDNCTPFDSLTFIQSLLPGTVIDYSTGLNDVNTGWDGTFRGVPVQEGVYVYYFRGGTE